MQVQTDKNPTSPGKQNFTTRFRDEIKLANLFRESTTINELLIGLKKEMRNYFAAEAFTIYFADHKKNQLVSQVKAGRLRRELRLPIDKNSIAGFVALTGLVLNIADAYDDAELAAIDPDLKFNREWDDNTKFTTRQVLSAPLFYKKKLFGVVQLINTKNGKKFSHEDADNLKSITEAIGRFIEDHKPAPTRAHTGKAPKTISDVRKADPYTILVQKNIISKDELTKARNKAAKEKKDMEKVLIDDFDLSRKQLGTALADFYKISFENLESTIYNPIDLIKGKNIDFFLRGLWVPLHSDGTELILAINDPLDHNKIQEVKQLYRTPTIELRFALKEDIKVFLRSFRGAMKVKASDKSVDDILDDLKHMEDRPLEAETFEEEADVNDNAVVLLVRKIIEDANHQMASDIHIEPYGYERDAVVRYRIDGRCQQVLNVPSGYIRSVVSRIKVLAKMDISEKRKPQDGKIRFRTSTNQILELRVATLPTTNNNEDVVLRLLASAEPMPLEQMMRKETFERFAGIIQKPYGIVMVVGPTGSGKTTTLHSALAYINKPERKIWTAEDPVEITQYGLRQLQVNPKAGPTFAQAMRAFLRADPDVIMVGEMRDHETVKMGIEASLTGHLVFSTLHTNSAPETITRLIDMGMDPFNFADALLGVLAQRLTRVLCPKCKEPYLPEKMEYDHIKELYGEYFDERLGVPYTEDLRLYKPKGCKYCNDVGYKGRIGLYELLLGDRAMKIQIIERCLVDDLREVAIKGGMTTLLQDGIHSTFLGKTDMKQVLSVCSR
ncbi:MAG: GspE/PulE family protein [Deltaproteobacteria bacterium]|jgi:type II secretory ATPase GspE/PulE/Tfp pilus assembly ATPase PilB-like protein|nr:GspE/PulE family protein [Deltaproteobacteria bacterium]